MTEEQRSEAWHARRCGKITASRAADAMAFKRDGTPAAARLDYAAELAVERIAGHAIGIPMNEAMKWGVTLEPAARAAYESHTGIIVGESGFVVPEAYPFCGASPDGYVGNEALVEFKCPFNPRVHVATIIDGMPKDHMPQIQMQLWVTGREWCDFVSFDPRMPEKLRLYRESIERDEKFIKRLIEDICTLDDSVCVMVKQLERYQTKEAA